MTTLASREVTGPAGALRWLADAYARYAHLVIAQLEALDDGDLDRFAGLAVERDALATTIDGQKPALSDLGPAADRILAEARHNLMRAADADRSLRRRLSEMSAESRAAIGEAAKAADRTAEIGRSYAPPTAPGGRLDVSF